MRYKPVSGKDLKLGQATRYELIEMRHPSTGRRKLVNQYMVDHFRAQGYDVIKHMGGAGLSQPDERIEETGQYMADATPERETIDVSEPESRTEDLEA